MEKTQPSNFEKEIFTNNKIVHELSKLKNEVIDPSDDFERMQKILDIKSLIDEIQNSKEYLADRSTQTQEKCTKESFLINGKIQRIYFIYNTKGKFGGTYYDNKIVINLGIEENIYKTVNNIVSAYYPILSNETIEQSVAATIKQEYFHMIDSQTRGKDLISWNIAESLSEIESLEVSDYYFVDRYITAMKNLVYYKYQKNKNPQFIDTFDGTKHYSFDGKTTQILRESYQLQWLCYYRALEKVFDLPENITWSKMSYEKVFQILEKGNGKINFGSDIRTYDKLIHNAFGHHINHTFIKLFIEQYKIQCDQQQNK